MWSSAFVPDSVTDGFLLVDKPGGLTSHDVVAAVRRSTGIRKVGHAGTLDPMATGLLVVAVGRVTRLIRFVQEQPKTYVARIVFGVATDTLDADGAVLTREPLPVSEQEVAEAAGRFVGRIHQVPPMVSALKVDGRRLYELAREGKEVARAPRPVDIHQIEILEHAPGEYPETTIRVVCGSGTYIRTLADDIAGALGGRAHLGELRRTAIGSHHVDAAVSMDDLGVTPPPLLTPLEALADLPRVDVGSEVARAVSHGTALTAAALGPTLEGPVRVVGEGGRLLAVYRVAGGAAKPEVVLT